ncbi:MAG: 3-deoxy-7-phosphoheptulonate synthase [Oligoflexia bacterium]|nr:3-deoxy-7-phosphoheptulonate synthase [Oligoflexia bacterium]
MAFGTSFLAPGRFTLVAGPCSIDSEQTFLKTAANLKEKGVNGLRGALFKMRTHSNSFQGLGFEGLAILEKAKTLYSLPIFTEVTDPRQIERLDNYVDVYQVGARNMFNYELLKELGKTKKPILLKRSFSALIDEWIAAADYIQKEGNKNVIFCERGIRTFENKLRNTLDLATVAYIKQNTSFKVMVDPSHGTGSRALIKPMALAAAAAGADGLLIEVHDEVDKAQSDELQAINSMEFGEIVVALKKILPAFGKSL